MEDIATDKKIKNGLNAGDTAVLDLLWNCHAEALLGYAQSILCSKQDAEDAIHELFLKVARNSKTVAAAENLKSYLFRMTRNEAINIINKRKRENTVMASYNPWLTAGDNMPPDENEAREIEEALKALPEEQRTIVVLKIYEEMQFNEIAEALEISQDTAASRFRYGIQKLKKVLRR